MEQIDDSPAASAHRDIAVLMSDGRFRDRCAQRREALLEQLCAALLRETGAARARADDDAPAAAGAS